MKKPLPAEASPAGNRPGPRPLRARAVTGRIRATFLTRTPGKRALKAVVTGTSVEAALTLTGERIEALVAPATAPAPADAGAGEGSSPAE